jgi:glycosyltransferase involved in cell wall biosynthesis
MKSIQLVEATASGVGRHVIDLTGGLLSRGHEVHLLYSDLRSDKVFAQDLQRLQSRSGFQGHRIPMRREPSGSDLSALGAMWRYLRKYGPFDLVHCHSTKAGLIGRLGLLAHSVKRLYTPHGFFTMDPTRGVLVRRIAARLEVALAKQCDGVVTVSREEYAHALQLGIPAAKLCRIANGVAHDDANESAFDRETKRRSWGLREGDVCVGFVGRLVPVKSPATMLKAFAALVQKELRPARLIMIGDGPLAAELRHLSSELGIQNSIVWLGEQNARPLMRAFDVLALTSESEAHPLVVLEALAQGLPIVATSVGGIADAVEPGFNGFVAPIRGWQQIGEALGTLLNNPALRARMGEASRARSLNYSLDRMVDQTLSFYDHIIAGTWQGSASPDWSVPALR